MAEGARPVAKPGFPHRWTVAGYPLLLGVAAAVLAVDQTSKWLVRRGLSDGSSIGLFGGLVKLDFAKNTGAAFSLLPSGGAGFALIAIVVSIGIVLYYPRMATSPLPTRLALGLILGGAIGNLTDRVRLGYVVDFVDLGWWPVFNMADSAIVIGVTVLVVTSLISDLRTVRRGSD